MKQILFLSLLLALAGCRGFAQPRAQEALYDFGLATVPAASAQRFRTLAVIAPDGLAGNEMRYRLAYRNPARVHHFAESRWVAGPARLLEQRLQTMAMQDRAATCTLRVHLEVFDQVFTAPDRSHAAVRLTGYLTIHSDRESQHSLAVAAEEPVRTSDAAGGAAALATAADLALGQLIEWSASLPCTQKATPSA